MALRFKLDENIASDVETLLSKLGHDVQTVLAEQLGGQADSVISSVCKAEDRILITFDLDFADIRQYPPREQAGVWVFRPVAQTIEHTLNLVRSALALVEIEPTKGVLWVVEPGRIRIREQ